MNLLSGGNTPKTKEEIKIIKDKAAIIYADFLDILGFNLVDDPQMMGTPERVAKMYVEELFKGCYMEEPKITSFPNTNHYDEMIFEGNIDVKSVCSHHIIPFVGKAHVAYIPKKDGKVIGLSKFNRIVDFYCRRPQIQEELTTQIHNYIEKLISPLGVAVMIEAEHMCVKVRGVQQNSTMITSKLSGVFLDNSNLARTEFYTFVNKMK
jgi:GTP cyclohydrolase IA